MGKVLNNLMNLYQTFLFLLIVSAIISLGLAAYALRHRSTPGAYPFGLILVGVSIWAAGYMFELLAPTLHAKIAWDNIQYVGNDAIAAGTILFALAYTNRDVWVKRVMRVIWIQPVLNIAVIWSDHVHHLKRSSVWIDTSGLFPALEYAYGPWMWCIIIYYYALVLVALVILTKQLIHTPRYYKLQTGAILLSFAVPVIGSCFTIAGLVPIAGMEKLDLSPITFAIMNPLMAWSLFHQRLFDIVPIARHMLVEHLPDGVIVVDKHHRIIDGNPAAHTLLHTNIHEHIGEPLHTLLPDIATPFEPSQPFTTTYLDIASHEHTSSPLPVQATVTPLHTHHRLIGWLVVLHDMTEQRAIDATLHRSEELLRETQRIARIGGWDIDLATDTLTWTPEMYHLHEVGTDFTLSPQSTATFFPVEHHPTLRTHYHALCTNGTPFDIEVPFHTASGKSRWVRVIGKPNYQRGKLVRVSGSMQDITIQKETELAQRESEARVRSLFEQTAVGIVLATQDGAFVEANPAMERLVGYSAAELCQMTIADLSHPDDVSVSLDNLRQLLSGLQDSYQMEKRYIRKDGSFVWIQLTVSRLYLKESQDPLAVGVVQDISRRKAAEEALHTAKEAAEAANLAKSTFLSSVSHELRTPLNAILGYAQLLLRDSSLTSLQHEQLVTINRSGNHLLNLINNVLEISRIEAGRIELRTTECDLYELLNDIHTLFKVRAQEKHIHLLIEHTAEVPRYIQIDQGKLRQILINLVTNAVKFTEQGSVALMVRCNGYQHHQTPQTQVPNETTPSQLCFSVEDTGTGIAENEIETVFKPFEQSNSGIKLQQGFGLGLAISQQFVHLMGGTLKVSSQVGVGTRFSFMLPVTVVSGQLVTSFDEHRRYRLAPDQPARRVLVVEDNADNREMLNTLLTDIGFTVREAVNGQDAIQQWKAWHPDIILMDLHMPDMDGYSATHHIKASSHPPPIIAITALAFEEDRNAALTAGCDDYIRKPFQVAELCDTLANHLAVTFVVDESVTPSGKSDQQIGADGKPSDTLVHLLAEVSPQWQNVMYHAAVLGNFQEMEELIEEIRPQHSILAERLYALVDSFQFEHITKVLEHARETRANR